MLKNEYIRQRQLRQDQIDQLETETLASPLPPGFDAEMLRRYLRHVMMVGVGVTEMRILSATFESATRIVAAQKYASTIAGWYDEPDAFVVDAHKIRGVSAYICMNPANRAIRGRSYNHLSRCRSTTTDDDIAAIRWIYLDLDSVRPSDVSATAAQREAAHARARQILEEHPGLARSSLWGSSGNGAYILAYLGERPNDEATRLLIKDGVASFSRRYTDSLAKIDPPAKNASRIGPLVGTLKCKGDHIPGEQEWSLVTLEGVGGVPLPKDVRDEPDLIPFDLEGWLGDHPVPEAPPRNRVRMAEAPGGGGGSRVAMPGQRGPTRDAILARAFAYVAKMDGAVSGDGGHNQTFDAACALIKGFDLSIEDARPILYQYNARCEPPWQPHELEHKLREADEKADERPRGYLIDAARDEGGAGEGGGAGAGGGGAEDDEIDEDDGEQPYVGQVKPRADYRSEPGVMTLVRATDADIIETSIIAHFSAQITKEVTWDDGSGETRKVLTIRATAAADLDHPRTVEVPADKFERMEWVIAQLGPLYRIEVGPGNREHTRSAIQSLSRWSQQVVYTQTGWRQISGQWRYLHGGGAIGTDGNDPSIAVDLSRAGARHYRLPEPPCGEDRIRAVRASLGMLRLGETGRPGSGALAATLFAATYRAAIDYATFSLQIYGPTGSLKSSAVALVQQHFGVEMTHNALPASWATDTPKAILELAHQVSDAILVVDDYIPRGSATEIAKRHADVAWVFQAFGNHQGRARLNSDGTPRPTKPPRCLAISTGEDRVQADSADARTLPIRVTRSDADRGILGTIDLEILTELQGDASAGLYAQSMAAFVAWLAPRLDDIRARMVDRNRDLRREYGVEGDHPRTPDILAELMMGAEAFLDFAVEIGAIGSDDRESRRTFVDRGLRDASAEIRMDRAEHSDPAERYLALVAASLQGGSSYISDLGIDGPPAGREASCGWRRVDPSHANGAAAAARWERPPGAARIGWISGDKVYLHPENSLAVVRKLAESTGSAFATSRILLGKLLVESGRISAPQQRGKQSRNTDRITVPGPNGKKQTLPAWSTTAAHIWPDE